MALLDGVTYSRSSRHRQHATVQLNKVTRGLRSTLLAKVEFFNPGGSVKDRIGVKILDEAEKKGAEARRHDRRVHLGQHRDGLAIAAAIRLPPSSRCPTRCPEKINLLKAMGAEVVVTPTAVPPESPESYYSVARRLAKEIPNAFLANQYFNDDNPLAHYESTGPEIWKQTAGKVTHYIATIGTGGTISGTGRYLKEQNKDIKVIGIDPEGSIIREYFYTKNLSEARPYKVEGIGEDIIPGTTHFQYIDEIAGQRPESLNMARRMAREEECWWVDLAAAMAGSLKYLADKDENVLAVVILPDTGERYLSKIYNDAWMRDNGLLDIEGTSIRDVLRAKKKAAAGPLSTVQATDTVRHALGLIREFDISQIPVMLDGRIAGTLTENTVMREVLEAPGILDEKVGRLMETALAEPASLDSVRRP
jgi:cystathionine beta-synthase